MSIVFDIETGPLDRDFVLSLSDPFPLFTQPPPFDAQSVAIGNLKDQAKIAEKIGKAKAAHEEECRNAWPAYLAKREGYERELLARAALDAATGQVLTIAYKGDGFESVTEGNEPELLNSFWQMFEHQVTGCRLIVSFCGHSFDLPFLVRRSLIKGVAIPHDVYGRNRYPHPAFLDLAEIWSCGGRRAEDRISLDALDRVLGGEGKTRSGESFARLYAGTPEERQEAIAYALNDVRITYRVAQKMGVL